MDATSPQHASLRGKRLILIEDDDRLFHALKEALQDAGCDVFGGSLSGAPSLLPELQADAAIVDGGSHSEHFLKLAQRLAERRIPTLFITSDLPAVVPSHWRSYLRKPFTEQQLLEGACAAVDQRPENPDGPGPDRRGADVSH